MEPEDLTVIGHTGDLLVDIYARNLTHIYILPQCSTTAARVLNPAGMDAQFERLRCAISRGILIYRLFDVASHISSFHRLTKEEKPLSQLIVSISPSKSFFPELLILSAKLTYL